MSLDDAPFDITIFRKQLPTISTINIELNEDAVNMYAVYVCSLIGDTDIMKLYIDGIITASEAFNRIYTKCNHITIMTIGSKPIINEKEQAILNIYKARIENYMNVNALNKSTIKIIRHLRGTIEVDPDDKLVTVCKMLKVKIGDAGFQSDLENNYEIILSLLLGYEYAKATTDQLENGYRDFYQQYLTVRPSKLSKQQINLLFLYYTFARHKIYVNLLIHRTPSSMAIIHRICTTMNINLKYIKYMTV